MPKRSLLMVVVLLLAVVAAGFWLYRSRTNAPPVVSESVISPEAMHAAWKTRVAEILQTYDRDQNAQAAEDALSELRVTADDKEIHLKLVLAFASIVQGDKKGAERLKQARAAFQAQP
jgi:hypothetical protein